MSYPFLANAQVLDPGTAQELDTLVTRLRTFLQVAHQDDGSLYPQAGVAGVSGGGSNIFPYRFAINIGPPASGQITFNAAGPAYNAVTQVKVHNVTRNGEDVYWGLKLTPNGSSILIQDANDHTVYALFKMAADPVDRTTYVEFAVTFVQQGTALSNNELVLIRMGAPAAAPTGGPPGPHHATHEPGGSDPLVVDAAATTGSLRTLGAGANQAAPGNAPRTPTAHHATHEVGGSDALVNAAWTNQPNEFTKPQAISDALDSADLRLITPWNTADHRRARIRNLGETFDLALMNDAETATAVKLSLNRAGGGVLVSGPLTEHNRTTPMGEWITVPFNAANFHTAGQAGTSWTVSAATYGYTLIGKTVILSVSITGANSVIAGTPTRLRIVLPTSTTGVNAGTFVYYTGGIYGTGLVSTIGSDLDLLRDILGTPWAAGQSYLYVTFIYVTP